VNPVYAKLVEEASPYLYSSASIYATDGDLITITEEDNPVVVKLNLSKLQRYDGN
jgi:hypothetical protein